MEKRTTSTNDYFVSDTIKDILSHSKKEEIGDLFLGVSSLNSDGKISSVEVISNDQDYFNLSSYIIFIHLTENISLTLPSLNEITLSSLKKQGLGYYLMSKDTSKLNIILEHKKKQLTPIDADEISQFFKKKGSLEQNNPLNFEERPSQVQMALNIKSAFETGSLYLCEAPTGTGKSMAYLINAVLWSIQNQQRVVISTNTIALQEQLYYKDIPFIQKILKKEFQFSMVKGRGRFLCLFRLEQLKEAPHLSSIENISKENLTSVLKWSTETSSGDRSDYKKPIEAKLWNEINVDPDICYPSKCPFQEECFYLKRKKENIQSHILVVNHHILCADSVIKTKLPPNSPHHLIPSYEYLIVDEAHNLEEVAIQYFSHSTSNITIKRCLNLIGKWEKKRLSRGILREISSRISTDKKKIFQEKLKVFSKARSQYEDNEGIFKQLSQYLEEMSPSNYSNEKTLRFKGDFTDDPKWKTHYGDYVETLLSYLDAIYLSLRDIIYFLDNEELKESLEMEYIQLEAHTQKMKESLEIIQGTFDSSHTENIKWIKSSLLRAGQSFFSFNHTPLFIGSYLKESLFDSLNAGVLTSATLCDNRGFDFYLQSIGLNDEDVNMTILTEKLPSSFDYEKQCQIYLPKKIAPPNTFNYTLDISKKMIELAFEYHGKTLVLFTSNSQLIEVYNTLLEPLRNLDIQLLKQDELPKHTLIEQFKYSNSVLLGLNSFWEGVDIPGDDLKCVIITKLPFSVPTEPYQEARLEYLKENGINSFQEFSIPQAIIKFKQGFGRLIRSSKDKGTFVVLDQRIVNKSYGSSFLKSLPSMKSVHKKEDLSLL